MLVKEFLQCVANNKLKGERWAMRLRDAAQLLVVSRLKRYTETLHLRFVWHNLIFDLDTESR